MSERPLNAHARKMFALIDGYQTSGLSQKAFCDSEGLPMSTFQYWLSRYRKHRGCGPQQDSRQLFVELKPAARSCSPACDQGVSVRYPNGVVVSLGAAVDLELLKALIAL